ncbi:MAG: M20/M25/M40 family metallo-hydrolase [Planctomycetes bacterium]|nr:M20/M25/M40 family metallo-hydrolase [Planctomycetota bacterium]
MVTDAQSPSSGAIPTASATVTAGVWPGEQSPAFSPAILLGHIYYLASDELGGRDVGTPGIERAARYIADQFAACGVEPGGVDGTYYQPFEVNLGAKLSPDGHLTVTGWDSTEPPVIEEDYTPFTWSNNNAFDGQVVFAGYGLEDPDRDYDDYAGLDADGKVVLLLRREPTSWSSGFGNYTRLARFDNKVATAKKHGAVAVLIANQKPDDDDEDRLVPFFSRGMGDYGLPAFHVTRALADEMLCAGGLDSLEALQARLDAKEPEHCSAPLPGIRLAGQAGLSRSSAETRNVVGLIRGRGPLADEYVVIGAHYDHVGRRARWSLFGRRRDAKPQIHNGADDNASGTAGLIELGRALARTARQGQLRRSVLLIAFSGEEKGLLGSRHFVKEPTVDLDSLVACLNMDMIGRLDPDSKNLAVYGTGTAEEFGDLLRRAARRVGLELDESEPSSGQSDDASFVAVGIPAMHVFSGMHADYHRPGDDPEKINEQDAARIVQLVYDVAFEIIQADRRPTYVQTSGFASIGRGNRVVMGVYPGSGDDATGTGLLIERVVPDGPAAKAGMKGGDRIIGIGGQEVGGLQGYMDAVRSKKAGDQVEVVVTRQAEEITLTVTLAAG